MASWTDFETEAPEMAGSGLGLWHDNALMYLATTRRDGSPRVHPVVPILADGRVFVAIGDWSPKWRDLLRDPRCVLHALPGKRDDEFLLRCRAEPAAAKRGIVADAAGHVVHEDDHIFELRIQQADHGYWENVGQPNTYAVRHRWVPGRLTQLKPN